VTEEKNEVVKRDDSINPVVDYYIHSPIVRGLINLVPYASGLDLAVATAYDNMAKRRVDDFFEALGRGEVRLTPEVIKSDEFLHRFMITVRAVTKQGEADKVQFFANLLKNGFDSATLSAAEYEELLEILDTLSARELRMLDLMQQKVSGAAGNLKPGPLPSEYWNRIIESVAAAIGTSREELGAMLTRVQRTGCYMENKSTSWDYGGQGYTTALWDKLQRFILES
jgi:hypothetical protein